MASDVSRLTLLSAVTIGINTTWAVKQGREPVTPIVAGAVGYVALSVVGGIWRWDIVNAIAGVFLLSALIFHGLPLGQSLVQLTNVGAGTKKKSKSGFSGGGGSF